MKTKRNDIFPGTSRGRALLTFDQVAEMRAEYKPRVVTYQQLARKYGVSEACIRDVISGRTWNANAAKKPRKNGRMRYQAGDKLETMEILEVLEETSSYKTTLYRVQLICGCDHSVLDLNGH